MRQRAHYSRVSQQRFEMISGPVTTPFDIAVTDASRFTKRAMESYISIRKHLLNFDNATHRQRFNQFPSRKRQKLT